MSEQAVKRYHAHQVVESCKAGLWVHAGDFNQKISQAKEHQDALQSRLDAVEAEAQKQRDLKLLLAERLQNAEANCSVYRQQLAERDAVLRECAADLEEWRMSFPDANATTTDSLVARIYAMLSSAEPANGGDGEEG